MKASAIFDYQASFPFSSETLRKPFPSLIRQSGSQLSSAEQGAVAESTGGNTKRPAGGKQGHSSWRHSRCPPCFPALHGAYKDPKCGSNDHPGGNQQGKKRHLHLRYCPVIWWMAASVFPAVTEREEEARSQQVLPPLTFILTRETRMFPTEPTADWESEAGCHGGWTRTRRVQACLPPGAEAPDSTGPSTRGGSPPTAVIGFQDFYELPQVVISHVSEKTLVELLIRSNLLLVVHWF